MRDFLPELIQLLSPKKDDIILDVGAGTGVIAEEVSKLCDEVFALEPDPKRVSYIKKNHPQVKAFDGTAEAIQFPELYFTKIYVVSVLHHFKDKNAALYEIHRVLRHGGLLVIKDSEPGTRKSAFESRAAHVTFLGSDELRDKLEETGFEVKEMKKNQGGGYFVSSAKG
ncbi:MAG TPA: class I SAM-dependent methyltransferase [Nitrososphaerales archaeon]|nr:class I SAM-dependent methyltransferase [Nitrososphaerales archaeon]